MAKDEDIIPGIKTNWILKQLLSSKMVNKAKDNAMEVLDLFAHEKFGDITAGPGEQKAVLLFRDGPKVAAGLVIIDQETKVIKNAVRKYDVEEEIRGFDLSKLL